MRQYSKELLSHERPIQLIMSFFTRLFNYWKSSEVNCYASVDCKDIFAELQNLVIFCFAEFLYPSRTVSVNFLIAEFSECFAELRRFPRYTSYMKIDDR